MKKKLPISQKKKFKYSITFQSFDEESLEAGDSFDSGYEIIDATDFIGDILYKAYFTYGIYMPVAFGTWESTNPLENTDYWEKGIKKYFAIHISNEDETQISKEESDFITFLLSDGHYELNKFREYAVGGVVIGSIALGIGALITYFYFKGKKGGKGKKELVSKTSKSVTYKINGKDRKFPIKDAWKKEHTLENQSEDYEVPQAERFEMGGDASEHYHEIEYGKGGVARAKDVIINKIGFNEYVADYLVGTSEKFAIWLADTILKDGIKETNSSKKDVLKVFNERSKSVNNNFITSVYSSNIREILDWLQHPLTPKQNLKELSFDQALEKAREWHNELQVLGGDIDFTEPETNTILKKYPVNSDGIEYYWVFIPSNYCDLESSRMGHCGRTGYGNNLISLRSVKAYGKGHTISDSHVTIAYGIDDGIFYQVKGKKNNKPSEKYFPYIFDLIKGMLNNDINKLNSEKIENINSEIEKINKGIENIGNELALIDTKSIEFKAKTDAISFLVKEKGKLEKSLEKIDLDFNFNGFGSEWGVEEDYAYSEFTKEEIREIYDLKPTLFESAEDNYMLLDAGVITVDEFKKIVEREPDTFSSFGNQMKLYERGIITEQPSTTFELKYDCDDVYRLLDIDRDYSDDLVAEILCGDIGELSDGWSYYYENPSDLVSNLNKENEQKVIDEIVRLTKLDESVVKENGIEYYLKGNDENFPIDDFDNIIRAFASAQNEADNNDYYNYLYKAIESALNELGEVHSLNDEGVKMTIDLSNSMTLEEIAYEMDDYNFSDIADLFNEKIGEYIDKPSLRIDDRYSPYGSSADFNEYISDIDLEQGYKKGGVLRTKNISTNKKIKNMKSIQNKFDDGGRLTHFNRHISMDSATRNELVEMTSYPFLLEYEVEENGQIKYDRIKSELKREGVSTEMIKNYLSGLWDGYNYSNTDAFKKEMAKLKLVDKEFYDKVMMLYEKISKYPKINVEYADGGRVTTNDGIIEAFITTNKQLNVGNISTHFNEYDNQMLLRNYGTLIATRKGNDVSITNIKYSKTTTTITNKIRNIALEKRMNISYVDKFAEGGMTEHGLMAGDTIIGENGYQEDEVYILDKSKNAHIVNLDKGERFADGGETREFNYLYIKEVPNGLKLELTDEGINGYKEEEINDMYDLFEDIQANSEMAYIDNAGDMGFGLTEAPIITDGYYYDDMGEFTDEGVEDSKFYVWNDYMIKDLFSTLMEQGSVVLTEVKSYNYGGETFTEKYIQSQGGVDYYSVDYDDVNAQEFRDDIFDTLEEAKLKFDELCENGKTFEDVPLDNVQLLEVYKSGEYQTLNSKMFYDFAKGGSTDDDRHQYKKAKSWKDIENHPLVDDTSIEENDPSEGKDYWVYLKNGYCWESPNSEQHIIHEWGVKDTIREFNNSIYRCNCSQCVNEGKYKDGGETYSLSQFPIYAEYSGEVRYIRNPKRDKGRGKNKEFAVNLMRNGKIEDYEYFHFDTEKNANKWVNKLNKFQEENMTPENKKLVYDWFAENDDRISELIGNDLRELNLQDFRWYVKKQQKNNFAKGGGISDILYTDSFELDKEKLAKAKYHIAYNRGIYTVIDNKTNKPITSFPTQSSAEDYIKTNFGSVMENGGKAYAEGGEAGNSFDDDDIAVYMCETEFGDDWFDGENYKDENVEAFYIAVHQYIKHLQGNLKLDKNEKPLYEGNLDNEDKKFIKDSLKESRYASKNNLFAKGGKTGEKSTKKRTIKKRPKNREPKMVRQYFDDSPYSYAEGGKAGAVSKTKIQITDGEEGRKIATRTLIKENKNGERITYELLVGVFKDNKKGYFEIYATDSDDDEYFYAEGGLWIEGGRVVDYDGVYELSEKLKPLMSALNLNSVDVFAEGGETGDDDNDEDYAEGGSLKKDKLQQARDYWKELEGQMSEKQKKFYNELLKRRQPSFEKNFNDSEIAEYINGEIIEQFGVDLGITKYQITGVNWFKLGFKYIAYREAIEEPEFWEEMNEYAEGGEATLKEGVYNVKDRYTLTLKNEGGDNWHITIVDKVTKKTRIDEVLPKNLAIMQSLKIGKLFYDNDDYAEGGEVEDWMEQALDSLIKETGNEDLDITMVSDNGNEFFAGNDMEEYRVFKTEKDAEEKAIEQVREDLEENPDYFNQDWLMNYIDGRDFFEEALNEMNYSYVEDIASETSGTKYNNRLIDELVQNGLMDEDDAILENAEEIADELKYDYVLLLTEEKLDEGNNGLDYFINNFGEKETLKMVINNNLIDIDEASQDAVNSDGIAHFISSYDGITLYLLNNNVAYRNN